MSRSNPPTGEDTADPWIGGRLGAGRYLIRSRLGEGGMGAVYAAFDAREGCDVAIKVLLSRLAKEARHLGRFQREVDLAALLEHPHLVRTFDTGQESDGTPWLAMELIEGETLSALLRRTGRLPPPRAVALMRQVVSALEAIHDAGIVHRDLKPANVMVSMVGAREHVKVVDLGLARFFDSDTYQKLTTTGQVVGTPSYMSVEQAFGDPIGPPADIYACGAILCAMVTGVPPFGRGRMEDILPRLFANDRRPLTETHPDIGTLAEVIERCLAFEANDRYASARQLDDALIPHDPSPETSVEVWHEPDEIATLRIDPDPVLDAPKPRRQPTAPRPVGAKTAIGPVLTSAAASVGPDADAEASPSSHALPLALLALVAAASSAGLVVWGSGFMGSTAATPSAQRETAPAPVVPLAVAMADADVDANAGTDSARPTGDERSSDVVPARSDESAERSRAHAPPSATAVTVTLTETAASLDDVRAVFTGPLDTFQACLRTLPRLESPLPRHFTLIFVREGGYGERNGDPPRDLFGTCSSLQLRMRALPAAATAGRVRFALTFDITDAATDSVRWVDASGWSSRPSLPPRLAITLHVESGSLPASVLRERILPRRGALTRCLEGSGPMRYAPPFRGRLEWAKYTEGPVEHHRPQPGMPVAVSRCFVRNIGRSLALPFATPGDNMEARYEMVAADRTSLTVVGD